MISNCVGKHQSNCSLLITWLYYKISLTSIIKCGRSNDNMKWSPDLAIGIEHRGEQHQEWFKRADDLFEAGRERRAKEVIGELLEFLHDYTRKHFEIGRASCRERV